MCIRDRNSSIVQGSGIAPSLFVVYISDLKASGKDNCIIKFADDCFLLVPEFADLSIEQEIVIIREWAVKNKMTLNILKTKEIVFLGLILANILFLMFCVISSELYPSQCQRKSTHIRHVDLKSTIISQKCIKTVTEGL